MIKKFLKVTFAFAIVLGLSACNGASATPQNTQTKLQTIVSKGVLVLGTSGNMAPMTNTINDGAATVGFDIDLARTMAETMGVRLSIKVMPLDKLVNAVKMGEVDIVISNMTITPKRNNEVAFVGPYLTSGKCLVTKIPDLASATKEELNESKKKIAVTQGSTSAEFAKLAMPNIQAVSVKSTDEAVTMIRDGKVEALLSDFPICKSIIVNNPDDKFVSVFTNLTYEPIGIAIAPQNTHLINWTQNFLVRANHIGFLKLLSAKWFK